ncbi:MAG TPA: hypothetical protein VIH55_05510 [Acidimicrobiia bacterium]
MSYRYIYIGLGLVAVAAIAFGLALGGGGDELLLPDQLEAISPQPGDLVPQQARVEVDLPVGYQAEIYVDGWLVEDTVFVEGTGTYRWQPSSANPTITEWSPGEHTVRVVWDRVSGLPDPGEFSWTFRVG